MGSAVADLATYLGMEYELCDDTDAPSSLKPVALYNFENAPLAASHKWSKRLLKTTFSDTRKLCWSGKNS